MEMTMQELKEKLTDVSETIMEVARNVREIEPQASWMLFEASEICKKGAENLRSDPAEIETEGGGSTWWHVCSECHGAVDDRDAYCRHCGSRFIKDASIMKSGT